MAIPRLNDIPNVSNFEYSLSILKWVMYNENIPFPKIVKMQINPIKANTEFRNQFIDITSFEDYFFKILNLLPDFLNDK